MKKYALDSNIISYLLKNNISLAEKVEKEQKKGNTFNIPPVVYYEVRRGLVSVNATAKIKRFDKLCVNFKVGEMNRKIWNEAVKIYANLKNQGKLIEDADIFIGAYCIVNDYILVTNNSSHLGRINGLNFIEWK